MLLSAVISSQFLTFELIDGLLYPSVAAKGFNVVLKPESANRLLEKFQVRLLRVEELRGEQYYVRIEGISEKFLPDGEIVWSTKRAKS